MSSVRVADAAAAVAVDTDDVDADVDDDYDVECCGADGGGVGFAERRQPQ